MTIRIRPLVADDWPSVVASNEEGFATGNATFETTAPDWQAWDAAHLDVRRFAAVSDKDEVVGWVPCGAESDRCVYGGVVEHSVYVAASARGQGVGAALLDALVASTEAAGIWTIQSGVLPENVASPACTSEPGSGWSAPGSGPANSTAYGGTPC